LITVHSLTPSRTASSRCFRPARFGARSNAEIADAALDDAVAAVPEACALLGRAVERLRLSARAAPSPRGLEPAQHRDLRDADPVFDIEHGALGIRRRRLAMRLGAAASRAAQRVDFVRDSARAGIPGAIRGGWHASCSVREQRGNP
jgi:hypothetical protein